VATAAIGSAAHAKENFLRKYKTELICAGVAAGITALFSSPLAGLLFAYEVIFKKLSKTFLATATISVAVASALLLVLEEKPLFEVAIPEWHYRAIPYFILLGTMAGLNSIYLTKCVLFIKKRFSAIKVSFHKVVLGAAILTVSLFFLPQLYGDGYHAIRDSFLSAGTDTLTVSMTLTILAILVMKPIITSVTLSSGGDGGVFAPSLFIGGFLGLWTALFANAFFNAGVIPVNFMVAGMAAMLSASIHAPFTAVFLVCGVVNDYALFFPILLVCLVSKYTAQKIYPYTVYSYNENLVK
ncbi:MAG TPA: chloride channel protein, partial [Flavobacterium sp.]|nr:chloride channel protein [Flavobacterium sp.]